MWYTGTGSGGRLTPKESALLHELGVCLADAGWSLRTGGRGVVDDVLHQAVDIAGGKVQTIPPYPHYRTYNATREPDKVLAFSSLSDDIRERALAMSEGDAAQSKFTSPLQRDLLASTVPMLLGPDLNTPSRFVLTWCKGGGDAVELRDQLDGYNATLFHTQEGPLFYLAKRRQIPVFNLANPEHFERVSGFLRSHRRQGVAVSA